jgi:hypothetical protein
MKAQSGAICDCDVCGRQGRFLAIVRIAGWRVLCARCAKEMAATVVFRILEGGKVK